MSPHLLYDNSVDFYQLVRVWKLLEATRQYLIDAAVEVAWAVLVADG